MLANVQVATGSAPLITDTSPPPGGGVVGGGGVMTLPPTHPEVKRSGGQRKPHPTHLKFRIYRVFFLGVPSFFVSIGSAKVKDE